MDYLQTQGDLEKFGFHCQNFIRVTHAASVVNIFTKKQIIDNICECCKREIGSQGDIYVVTPRKEITKELIERINNAKLVAWRPLHRGFGKLIAFRILDDELIGYEI